MTTSEFIAKARKIDTMIAQEWTKVHAQSDIVRGFDQRIKDAKKYAAFYSKRAGDWSKEIATHEANIEKFEEKRDAAMLIVTIMSQEVNALDHELYEGWNRFFLVKHIHNSMYCSSFRMNTRIGWLPSVSGLTEAEAVAEHGESLCTICFPSAPTELTQKQVDPTICTGTLDPNQPHELRRMSKWGTCTDCGERVSASALGNLRKHKK